MIGGVERRRRKRGRREREREKGEARRSHGTGEKRREDEIDKEGAEVVRVSRNGNAAARVDRPLVNRRA